MRFNISRVWHTKLEENQKKILGKYNLEIVKEEIEYYTITINSIDDLIEIAKELDEELIINKDKSITIYDDYIE